MFAASPLTGIFVFQPSFRAPESLSLFLKLECLISTNAKISVRIRSVRFLADQCADSETIENSVRRQCRELPSRLQWRVHFMCRAVLHWVQPRQTLLSAEAARGHCRYRKALLPAASSCDLQARHKAMLHARAGGWMLVVLALTGGWVGRQGMRCDGGGCYCTCSFTPMSFWGGQVFFYPSYHWIKINGNRTETQFSRYIFFCPSHFHAGKQILSNILA